MIVTDDKLALVIALTMVATLSVLPLFQRLFQTCF